MKYSLSPVGMDIIEEIEGKAEIISNKFRNKTIQKVLISRSKPTNDLASCVFFLESLNPKNFFKYSSSI
jgi:ribosome-binding factor A